MTANIVFQMLAFVSTLLLNLGAFKAKHTEALKPQFFIAFPALYFTFFLYTEFSNFEVCKINGKTKSNFQNKPKWSTFSLLSFVFPSFPAESVKIALRMTHLERASVHIGVCIYML